MHPFLAVPLIALADASLVSAIFVIENIIFDGFMNLTDVAWIGFVFGGIFALIAGGLLAWPFRIWGNRIPRPLAIWFTVLGAVVGLLISAGTAATGETTFLLMMVTVAGLSGFLWWFLVERKRDDWDHRLA